MSIDSVRQWLSTLPDTLPKPLCDALVAIYRSSVFLTEQFSDWVEVSADDMFSSLSLQTVLPPLISIITIYFALVSLYRTTSFFVRSAVFLVKWGALIGAAGAAFGCIANIVAPDSFGFFNQGDRATHRGRNPSRSESTRPHIWDSFQQHQRWSEEQSEENFYTGDAGNVAREIVENLVDATQHVAGQDGWLGALTGMAVKAVIGEVPKNRRRRRKGGKGKAKSR